ncbi:MAG TPA: sodium:solute symporter [bacterium]|nr:sodium:solute symporter [bacterium]
MYLTAIDFVVLAVYLAAVVGLGVWAGRGDRNTDDYFVGGRRMPGWLVGVSILGTCVSSVTYVAYPGFAFAHDWEYLVQGLMLPVVLFAGGLHVATFYRRRVKTSVNEFLEERFGPGVRTFSLTVLLISEVTRVATVMYLFSLVVHTITGLNIVLVIVVIGAITVVYAVLGGIRGVIWTDLIQTIVLLAGGVITVIAVGLQVPGGLPAVISEAAAAHKFTLFDFTPDLSRDTFYVLALSGLTNYFYFLAGNQNQVQRYQCAASDHEAKKAALLGSLLSVPTWALFLLVGTCLYVFYQHHPDPAVQAFILEGKPDKIFPHFIAARLPPGVSGLLLAGLFGAAMSTLDSSMNASSTLFVTDVYRRFLRPGVAEARAFAVARLLTLFWGCLGIVIAIAMIKVGTFLQFYFSIVSIVLGAVTGVFFLALVVKRSHARGVIAGIGAGFIVTAWGSLTWAKVLPADSGLSFPWHPIMVGVLGCFAVIIVGYAASLVMKDGKGGGDEEGGTDQSHGPRAGANSGCGLRPD